MVSDKTTATLRRLWRRKTAKRRALLGDGAGNVDVEGQRGRVWVRLERGVDANGLTVYGGKTVVKAGVLGSYIRGDNVGVIVAPDFYGDLAIESMDAQWLEAAGINPAIANHLTPELQFVTLAQISMLLSRPVGVLGQSPYVNVHPLLYINEEYKVSIWEGTSQTTQIDLSLYLPSAGKHRVAVLVLNTNTNAIDVVLSEEQNIAVALDLSDVQEAIDKCDDNVIPVQAYRLAHDSYAVTVDNLFLDLRQVINVPSAWGFPTLIKRTLRIVVNRQVIVYNQVTVDVNGQIVIDGELVIL